MAFRLLKRIVPSWKNVLLAILSAVLLILAFPDFEYWFLAWFALVPLMWAVERETKLQKPARSKGIRHAIDSSIIRSFALGWIFGTIFFSGTCWWLTYAPINYAGFQPALAYFLLLCVTAITGLFPGIFTAILAVLLRRFGSLAFLAAPFVWVTCEFARYWITGNNWNAIGYSQAFHAFLWQLHSINVGGVYLAAFDLVAGSSFVALALSMRKRGQPSSGDSEIEKPTLEDRLVVCTFCSYFTVLFGVAMLFADKQMRELLSRKTDIPKARRFSLLGPVIFAITFSFFVFIVSKDAPSFSDNLLLRGNREAYLVAIQPNVRMDGLDSAKLDQLRYRHAELSQNAFDSNAGKYPLLGLGEDKDKEFYRGLFKEAPKLVVFPESPMNFMYSDDREFSHFINDFARQNNVSVLFNSSEPDKGTTKYFNSAVMVGPDGNKVEQYDKIYLLPFGEAVPSFLEGIVPGFVGNFAYGREYDLFPVGDAKAGVMICFESHFGALGREYVRNGADVIIEMTNDGYLGPTPVLRQHLANAVFRAVETNRPVLRVTNVGITAYITERGEVLDATQPYQEDTRVWSVSKSDGSQTFYVKYGDWFAWLCTLITIGLIGLVFRPNPRQSHHG